MVNETELKDLDPTGTIYQRAVNTYEAVGLGNKPARENGEKDRRFLNRNASYHRALQSLTHWQHIKDAPDLFKEDMKKQILMTAAGGWFRFGLDDSFFGRTGNS